MVAQDVILTSMRPANMEVDLEPWKYPVLTILFGSVTMTAPYGGDHLAAGFSWRWPREGQCV